MEQEGGLNTVEEMDEKGGGEAMDEKRGGEKPIFPPFYANSP